MIHHRLLGVGLLLWGTAGVSAQSQSALQAARESAQRDSNDPVAHYRLALAFVQAKAGDSAIRELRSAIAIDPQFAAGYRLLGRLIVAAEVHDFIVVGAVGMRVHRRIRGDSTPDAAELLRRAFLLDPLADDGRPGLYEFPAYWRGTLQRAFHHRDQNKLELALQDFAEVIHRSAHPGDPRSIPPVALWYHAQVALQLGLVDSAIVDARLLLDRALRLEADSTSKSPPRVSPEFEYILAHLEQRGGHLQEAERLYKKLLEENVALYTGHIELARIYESESRWDEAVVERRSAVDVDPDDPSVVFDLGLTLANAGRDSLAEDALRSALAANPREVRALYVLGIVSARLNHASEARAAFEQFLATAPGRYAVQVADARARLGMLR
jgi:tetratricopeptide (TPR) repeat protein